jgi:hypothetical protein
MQDLRLELVEGARAIAPASWAGLADDPFTDHAFLRLLEDTRCVGPRTGWTPRFLTVWRGDSLEGVLPAYLRADSYGEYIFDWAWAQGAQRAGLRYYPKVTVAVPFTPATGRRILVRGNDPVVAEALIHGLQRLTEQTASSGSHVLFCPETELPGWEKNGWLRRWSSQYHWTNAGYRDFDDFLSAFTSKRRKEIRRERRRAREHGLEIVCVEGRDLTEAHWHALAGFYAATHAARPWQQAYLSPAWWQAAPAAIGDRAVAVLALRGPTAVAGSLAFRSSTALYGRYWGSLEDWDGLHFECCYHRLVEYAIDHGLGLFEAGAQGDHKVQRGFLPRFTWSVHRFHHAGLHEAVASFLSQESVAVRAHIQAGLVEGPFRVESAPPGADW